MENNGVHFTKADSASLPVSSNFQLRWKFLGLRKAIPRAWHGDDFTLMRKFAICPKELKKSKVPNDRRRHHIVSHLLHSESRRTDQGGEDFDEVWLRLDYLQPRSCR